MAVSREKLMTSVRTEFMRKTEIIMRILKFMMCSVISLKKNFLPD